MIRRNESVNRYRYQDRNLKRSVAMVWTAVLTTVLIGFLALSVDVGYIYLTRNQLQVSADAAAMAAASKLTSAGGADENIIRDVAREYAQKNKIGDLEPVLDDGDVVLGRAVQNDDGKFDFLEGQTPYDAVKVTVRLTENSPNGALGTFFGRILGVDKVNMSASAIATLIPRDIAVVIDLSNSMSYDSQLKHEDETEINIKQVWEGLGTPTFGNMTAFHNSAGEMPRYTLSTSEIKSRLGLNNVPYPYPKGSWDEYIRFVQNDLKNKGETDERRYRDRYGLRTWVHYLLDKRHLESETPDLKDCPVQPVTALKDAVEELCAYLILMDSGDQMALISYSHTAWLEHELTRDFTQIIQVTREQQAGGKGSSTNIASGIERARQELKSSRARPTAKKVMIVLTDGKANQPSNERTGKLQAINSGHSAVAQGIQIYTISLGTDADQELMAELAELGKGIHFHVPTFDISQYEEELKRIFKTLGGKRPIRLIG